MRSVRFAIPLLIMAAIGLTVGWFYEPTVEKESTKSSTTLLAVAEMDELLDAPLIAVVPHHNLVASQRQSMLAELAAHSQPETIILVSPNHYDLGTASVLTTDRVWSINNNQTNIYPDTDLVEELHTAGVARLEDTPFDNEHGIKNLLDDIHSYFPQAKLLPLILKSTTTQEEEWATLQTLVANCPDCGVIASVDMSHYQPAAVADMHDVKTLRALTTLDEDEAWEVEVDSNASLVFLVQWAKAHEANRFTLFDHTNSGVIANNPDTETTTHIFGSYSNGQPHIPDRALTFTLAGDAMFGRLVQNFQSDYTQLFSQLGNRTFWGTDVSWINLEGPLSNQPVRQIGQDDPLVFNFPVQSVDALTYLKLTTVGLANNHTANQGAEGLQTTRRLLKEAGLEWVGDPSSVTPENSVRRHQAGGLNLSVIAVSDFSNLSGLEELITQEKTAGQFVLVLPHWGLEYQPTHSLGQHTLATAWSDAGADLVIGMHPHVIQDAELINHTLVLYSLGNFIFDQTFSTDTQQGLIVTGELTDQQVKIVLTPIQSTKLKPAILQGEVKQQIMAHVCQHISSICSQGVITLAL